MHTTLEQVDEAVAHAVEAQRTWAALAPAERAGALRAFAAAVDGAVEELAQLEVRNSGHPIGSARWEAGHVRDVLNYYAGAPERMIGQQIPVAGGMDVTFHEPLGVVGVIVPWNFPMTIASWGFAPALAAGNAVLLKPADWTPLTAIRLGELAAESGLPKHLFQVLPGRGSVVGERFVTHEQVRKIVFTGSTEVGKQVAAGCAAQVKPVTLELGGKSANVVFADSDLEKAAATAPGSVFDNAGQDCCARSRILVERSVLDRFLELLEPAVKAFKVGSPVRRVHRDGPAGLEGAPRERAVASSTDPMPRSPSAVRRPRVPGTGCRRRCCCRHPAATASRPRRSSGPWSACCPFDDEADAIALANDSVYGLSGSIWTNDLGRAIRVARGIESGTLSVNSHSSVRYTTPFGGAKQSGLGRELGPDAALAFTDTKNVFFAS